MESNQSYLSRDQFIINSILDRLNCKIKFIDLNTKINDLKLFSSLDIKTDKTCELLSTTHYLNFFN